MDGVAAAPGPWRLDGAVALVTGAYNAGVCDDGPIEEQSLDELVRVIDVNLVSVLDMCRLAAPLLLATPGASVVNVASMYGIVSSRGPMAGYNATKGAEINLTRQLAAQWGSRRVRVNALAPGYFPTPLPRHRCLELHDGTGAGHRRRLDRHLTMLQP